MRDKGTIINQIVSDAARIMEMKMEFNELVIEQMVDNPDRADTVRILTALNKRIKEAIEMMRENEGCWS